MLIVPAFFHRFRPEDYMITETMMLDQPEIPEENDEMKLQQTLEDMKEEMELLGMLHDWLWSIFWWIDLLWDVVDYALLNFEGLANLGHDRVVVLSFRVSSIVQVKTKWLIVSCNFLEIKEPPTKCISQTIQLDIRYVSISGPQIHTCLIGKKIVGKKFQVILSFIVH